MCLDLHLKCSPQVKMCVSFNLFLIKLLPHVWPPHPILPGKQSEDHINEQTGWNTHLILEDSLRQTLNPVSTSLPPMPCCAAVSDFHS